MRPKGQRSGRWAQLEEIVPGGTYGVGGRIEAAEGHYSLDGTATRADSQPN